MHPLVEAWREEIAEVCRRYHVRRLDVFGSATSERFDPAASDVDFIVEFDPDRSLDALRQYFGLKESMEALFGIPVDLVISGAVTNPYLRASMERSRETLYAA
ncbi:MAG: nucleotidyltransferase family protein [Chloroflexota bacterium]